MNFNEYQAEAMKTANSSNQTLNEMFANAALGLSGEAGEFADHIKKHLFQGHCLDREKLLKELGDVLWYVSLGASSLGRSLDEVAQMNIEKLRARYPEGHFEAARSTGRKE